jgi:hypothetical protein
MVAELADQRKGALRILTGSAPGSHPDKVARLLARRFLRQLPQAGEIEVINHPAGLVGAINAVYESDGEPLIGVAIGAEVRQQLLGAPEVRYDVRRMRWFGGLTKLTHSVVVRADLDVTLDEVMAGRPLRLAAGIRGASPHDTPLVLNAALRTQFMLTLGFHGMTPMVEAIENGDADGLSAGLEALTLTKHELFAGPRPFLRFLLVMGDSVPDHEFLRDAAAAETLAPSAQARALLRAISDPTETRALVGVGPTFPRALADRLEAAFQAAVTDPAFQSEMETRPSALPVVPSSADEVRASIERTLSTPPDVLAELQSILA